MGCWTPNPALGPALSLEADLPGGPPQSGQKPCRVFSPGSAPCRDPAPSSRGPALTGPQRQGAGAPAQVGGHQVGYLWPRLERLAVGYKERQAEDNQEPCTGVGPEMDTRLDRDPEAPRKRKERHPLPPSMTRARAQTHTHTRQKIPGGGGKKEGETGRE